MKAKIAIIAVALVAIVMYVHWMMEPAYRPPDGNEEVKKVVDGVTKARAAGKAPSAPERVQREDEAMKYLQSLVAAKKEVPRAIDVSHQVFVPPGAWPGGDNNLALGLAELYSTYFHADGTDRKTVIGQDFNESDPLAREKDDGEMQLVDKHGVPLP